MEHLINKILAFKHSYKNYLEFRCPSCGSKCHIDEELCSNCKVNLEDFKKIVFSNYELLNKAYKHASDGNYFEAYTEIIKFLSFYRECVDANKLKIYLLVKLGQLDLAKVELQKFEKDFPRNIWLMEFENLEDVAFPKFDFVVSANKYYANVDSFYEILNKFINNNVEEIYSLVNLINEMFKIKKISADANNSFADSFVSFYKLQFLPFLINKEISLLDYTGLIYEDLPDEQKHMGVKVSGTIKNDKKKNGEIVCNRVGILYRSAIIQSQTIEIVEN